MESHFFWVPRAELVSGYGLDWEAMRAQQKEIHSNNLSHVE
jgi:hypothetical protein